MNGLRTAAGLAEFKAASNPAQVLPKYEKNSQRDVQITAETLWGEICPKITAVNRNPCVVKVEFLSVLGCFRARNHIGTQLMFLLLPVEYRRIPQELQKLLS